MQNLSIQRVLLILMTVASVIIIYTGSGIQAWINDHVRLPADFLVRESIEQSPELDPRIKVFAFDDQAVYAMGYGDLSLTHWASLIAHFAQRKPKAIFIDKVFGLPLHKDPASRQREIDAFQEILQTVETPIIVGGFVSPEKKFGRQEVNLNQATYHLSQYLGPDYRGVPPEDVHLPIEALRFYGPHTSLRFAFKTGHIVNDSYGYIKIAYRLSEDHLVPASSILAAGQLNLQPDGFYSQQTRIPSDQDNRVQINFPPRQVLYENTLSILPVILRLNRGQPEAKINPGDIVVILPAMFTGNTDFKASPIGKIQGGYFSVSVINSILTGRWITPFDEILVFMLLLLVVGGFWANYSSPLMFNLIAPGILVGLALCCCLAFAYLNWSIDWISLCLSFALGSLSVFLERIRMAKQYSNAVLLSLHGAISPDLAKSIAKDPTLVNQEPTEQVVTIMFIDIVGFSLTSERQTPQKAFEYLKSQLNEMVQIIHRHGGVVDKSLGDGLLCFFGYDLAAASSRQGHADAALACAIEIQRHSVDRILADTDNDQNPIYPLRIGINSASVYLGNLGARGRIDFTLIGNGVNFAARLENACEPFKINMGVTTYDLLRGFEEQKEAFSTRKIRIKHHKKPHTCYEFNPFVIEADRLRRANRLYLEYHNLYSTEERWLAKDDQVLVRTQFGEGTLVNFSSGGIAFHHPKNLANDTVVNIEVLLRHLPKNQSPLQTTTAVICWCRSDQDQYLLGAKFNLFDEHEAEAFRDELREKLKNHGDISRKDSQDARKADNSQPSAS